MMMAMMVLGWSQLKMNNLRLMVVCFIYGSALYHNTLSRQVQTIDARTWAFGVQQDCPECSKLQCEWH